MQKELISRGQFLKNVGLLAGSAILASCAKEPVRSPVAERRNPVNTPFERVKSNIQILEDEVTKLGITEDPLEVVRWEEIRNVPLSHLDSGMKTNEWFAQVAYNMQESGSPLFQAAINILNQHVGKDLQIAMAGESVIIDGIKRRVFFKSDLTSANLSFRLYLGSEIRSDHPLQLAFDLTRYTSIMEFAISNRSSRKSVIPKELMGFAYGREAQAFIHAYGLGLKKIKLSTDDDVINEYHAANFVLMGSDPNSKDWQQYIDVNFLKGRPKSV